LCDTESIKIPMTKYPAESTWGTDNEKGNLKLNAGVPENNGDKLVLWELLVQRASKMGDNYSDWTIVNLKGLKS
jgi:hypothetical protein